jgi:hypothetical protein
MIILSGAIGALAVAAALALLEAMKAPRAEIGVILLPHLPALAIAGLAVYALCATLLTTATMLAGILRLRHHLARNGADRVQAPRDWVTDFALNSFQQLAPRLASALAESAGADARVGLQTRLTRSGIARLYYISLARSHFFSALIVLTGVVGLGIAQDHGSLPYLSGATPTGSAILILVGLLLLAVLGRIAIDVTSEPLLEAISQLPAERVEVGLLRRTVELLEVTCNTPASDGARGPSAPQLPERLVAVIEQGHQALLDAVGRLTASIQALETATRSSVETLETVVRPMAAEQQPIDENRIVDATAVPELRAAIEELTAVLQRLSASPEDTREPALATADPVPRRKIPAPRIAQELQRLLQEIEAAH